MTTGTEQPTRTRTTRTGLRPRAAAPPRPRPAPDRARTRTGAPRMPFVLLVLGLLGGGLVTLLMLHAVLAEDTFAITTLQRQNQELARQEQALREKVLHAESPEAIAEAAEELGMRPGDEPRFIDVRTGEVTNAEPDQDTD